MFVAGEWFVGLVEFEVGGGGVEEQQVDFQVQQGGHRPEDFLLQGVGDLAQPVHGPVAGVVVGGGQARKVHVVGDPVGGGELRRGRQCPVGDQREQVLPGRLM